MLSAEGQKKFELRKNDRDFKVGDYLALNEWDGEAYTGRSELVKVIYAMNANDIMNSAGGYLIMSIERQAVCDRREAKPCTKS